MAKKISYDNWSREELVKELKRIKETKYGLVWHRDLSEEKIDVLINPDARTPSEMFPNEMAGKPFPVLKEVKTKEIETDKSKPVNLLIEGDNYHSLAVLNFTHEEAIDLIYIDPPYNTGNNDFKYNDKFIDAEDPFKHSKWLSFMEKRLKLSHRLLKETGAIFISIDDNEQAPLKMLCDEIFGEDNFIESFIWIKKNSAKGVPPKNMVVNVHENILCYGKSSETKLLGELRTDETFSNNDNDPRGPWRRSNIKSTLENKKNKFVITDPITGNEFTNFWAFSQKTLQEMIEQGRIIFPKNSSGLPKQKEYLNEFSNPRIPIMSHLGIFDSQATTEKILIR